MRQAPAQKSAPWRLRILTPRAARKLIPVFCFEKDEPAEADQDFGGVGLRNRSGLQIRRQPRAPTPRGAGFAPARPGAKSRTLKRQTILTLGLHDGTLPASLGDGQLCRAPGTVGEIHDLLAQLVIPRLWAETGQSLGHVLRVHLLASRSSLGGCKTSGGKTQRVRVQ